MFRVVFRETRLSVFSVSLRKHFGTSKGTAVRTGLRFGGNGRTIASTCQFLIEEGALTRTSPRRNVVSAFGAWRNVCDFSEANWKFTRGAWKELEDTLGCPSILPANVQGRVDGWKPTVRWGAMQELDRSTSRVRVPIADDHSALAEGLTGEQMDKCRFVRQEPLVWPESNGSSCEP
jgi:hypothetical protein